MLQYPGNATVSCQQSLNNKPEQGLWPGAVWLQSLCRKPDHSCGVCACLFQARYFILNALLLGNMKSWPVGEQHSLDTPVAQHNLLWQVSSEPWLLPCTPAFPY